VLTSFPGAAVNPSTIRVEPVAPTRSNYLAQFEVVVGVEGTDPTTSLKTAIQYANKIIESISDDRTLSGVIDNIEVIRVTPELARLPQYTRCWTLILLECRRVRR